MADFGNKIGSFGDKLINGSADALTGGLASGVSGLVSGLFGMIGAKKREKRQLENQMKLNEQAAKVNYEYGEKAAENAFQRQMEMYQQSYKDQSYSAMRKQMEDAGLSVGMMYGGGAAGGEGGATSGAPQASTGGAVAGDAAAVMQNELGLRSINLQNAKLQAEIENIRASTKKSEAETNTEDAARDAYVQNLIEEGRGKWIENLRKKIEDSEFDVGSVTYYDNGEVKIEPTVEMFKNKLYGDYAFSSLGATYYNIAYEISGLMADLRSKLTSSRLMEKEIKVGDSTIKMNDAIAELNNEKKKYYFQELMIAAMRGQADMVSAMAQKLSAEFETGVFTNWKTWTTIGMETLSEGLSLLGKSKGFSKFEPLGRPTLKRQTKYNARGKEISSTEYKY